MTIEQVCDIAENKEVTIYALTLEKREALSMMDSDGNCYIAIDPLRVVSSADGKTKLAHELGHCVMGAFYNVYTTLDIRQKHENTADKWAIKKLIPEEELNAAVKEGCTEMWQLAEYFGVTESFIRKAVSLYKFGNLYSV
jgi:hypothetical protein